MDVDVDVGCHMAHGYRMLLMPTLIAHITGTYKRKSQVKEDGDNADPACEVRGWGCWLGLDLEEEDRQVTSQHASYRARMWWL